MHSVASSSSVPFPDYDNVVASTWSLLEQTPPPTLREILGAYNSRGDGDRDMLLAMLNAKSAEDQRVASVAALQRAMLQVYQGSPPPSPHPALLSSENPNYSPFTRSISLRDHTSSTSTHHSSRRPTLPSIRSQHSLSASLPPRKRHRTVSRSPPSRQHTHDRDHNTHSHSALSPHELPPSPHSWSSGNESAEYSPRTRQSMAIGSLLSSRPDRDDDGRNTNSSEPN